MSILIIALILPVIIISIIASTKSEDQEHGVGMFAFDNLASHARDFSHE